MDWLGLEGLQGMARPGATIIRVPSMFFTGQLPCWSYLGGGPGRLQGYRMSYHCLPVAAMVLRGLDPAAVVEQLHRLDFLDEEWSRNAVRKAVVELARREEEGLTEIRVSDLYAALAGEQQVGHTINHPVRRVFARAANRILRLLGEPGSVPEEGPDYLPLPHLPLLPATERALGLKPDGAAHFRLGKRTILPADYIRDLVAHYRALPAGKLEEALRESREAMSFFADIAATHPSAEWARLEMAGAEPTTMSPPGPISAGPRFSSRPAVLPWMVPGAKVLSVVPAPWTRSDLQELIRLDDEAEREAIGRIAPASRAAPFTPAEFRLVQLTDASVINFPRTEGMVLDAAGSFVRGTRGSPRVVEENPFERSTGRGEMQFRDDMPISGEIGRAFVGFCPASANYAHFLGLFVQRLMIARSRLADTAFLVPDLPEYSAMAPGALRNEFMFRLPEKIPLADGNCYRPLKSGAYRVRELLLLVPHGDRWDLMFQPEVRSSFDALAAEALRRARLSAASLPERLYVSRQAAGRRRIVNHEAFLSVMEAEGFVTVRMEELDFWEQAAHFAAARTIVTVHGAGCANLLFSAPGTTLIEMYPRPLLSHQFVHTALSRDCRHVPLPCRPMRRQDVEVDLDALRAALAAAR